jgi:hypothetical protein
MKYKVGDTVLLKVTIKKVDDTDTSLPYSYRDTGNNTWFDDSVIVGLAPVEIPGGWTPVSEKPDNIRDVMCLTVKGKERRGWYNETAIDLRPVGWYLWKHYDSDTNTWPVATNVIGWKEIE